MFWLFNKKRKEKKMAELEWVKKVIDSCKTLDQVMCCRKLVSLWEDKHDDHSLSQQLIDKIVNKILSL